MHLRRTGSTGFHGISGPPGSAPWWAGVLFVLALVLGAATPALALASLVVPPKGAVPDAVSAIGITLMVIGAAAVLLAQSGMGTSWRIGVDQGEQTDLVTGGVFALVRNPVFSAMVLTQLGMALAVPTWLSLAAVVCLVLAVEMQVRVVEEPYLAALHGPAYAAYTERTGRFLPGVGRQSRGPIHGADGRRALSPSRNERTEQA